MTDIDELKRLAEALPGWSNIDKYWPQVSEYENTYGAHVVGAIVDGEQYDLMVIDADTYGTDGESEKLAAFYAAANPAAVLELIERLEAA